MTKPTRCLSLCSLDGYGKYHLFGCDHRVRYYLACDSCEELIDQVENCGGFIP